MEAESRIEATVGVGVGVDRELLLNEAVSVWEDEQVLEMDSEDGCTTLCMYMFILRIICMYVWAQRYHSE